jgi:DNA-binding transcriptional ArsR family regulator
MIRFGESRNMDSSESLAVLFKALTHPARLQILEILREGEQCVCHMEAQLGYRQAYISQHLMVLREAGLVEDRRDGWNIFYRVVEPRVYDLIGQARLMMGVSLEHATPLKRSARSTKCPCPKCAASQTKENHAGIA